MTQKTLKIRIEISSDPARGQTVSIVVGPRSYNFAVFINDRCPGITGIPPRYLRSAPDRRLFRYTNTNIDNV
jgi:hypothetical protein